MSTKKKKPPRLRSVPAPTTEAQLFNAQAELLRMREETSDLRMEVLKSAERITRAEAQAYLHREQAQRAEALLGKALEALPALLQPVQAAAFDINAQPSHFQGQDLRFALTQWLGGFLKRMEEHANNASKALDAARDRAGKS